MYSEIDELTFIENCLMSFSQTSSLHWVSAVDFSHIWLDRSSFLLEWLSIEWGLILSLLGPSWKAIYKTHGSKRNQNLYIQHVCTFYAINTVSVRSLVFFSQTFSSQLFLLTCRNIKILSQKYPCLIHVWPLHVAYKKLVTTTLKFPWFTDFIPFRNIEMFLLVLSKNMLFLP